ncbi:MAG: FG-GAP-like repeat-containing protein [Cellvibrio sp.]|uniref:RHS repeat-associated core domain-containing protein n=1 Tax=Cellvibrio sp. TaxID=1965322 RepID=UPI002716A176|nr:FG-GAP-like repeat-containing protein [Cellvibrio sp.]
MFRCFFFLFILTIPSLAFSQSFSLPTTSSTGSYTITYSASGTMGLVDELVGGQWTTIGGGQKSGVINVNKTISGTYTYKLKNCNPNQSGTNCTDVPGTKSITVNIVPATPVLSVTGIENTASNIDTNGTFSFSWPAVANAEAYALERNGGVVYYDTATAYNTVSLGFGTYTFRVKACRANATVCSGYSNTITITIQYPQPAQPGGITFSNLENAATNTDTNGAFTVNWGASTGTGIEAYSLERNGNVVHYDLARTYNASNLPPGTYTFRVRACRDWATNCSAWTASQTVTVVAPSPSSSSRSSSSVALVSSSRSSSSIALTSSSRSSSSVALISSSRSSSSRSSSSVALTSSSRSSSSVALTSSSRSSSLVALTSSSRSSSSSTSSQPNFDTDNGIVNSTPPSTTTGSPVGALAGEFRVDESGSATYNMPIAVPEGVAGVKPQFSIGYNSQGGAGIVGVGANMSGIGAISRCRQTLLQDGGAKPITWTGDDRFCLNGQRLMLVSTGSYGDVGSVYKTEIDAFVKVTAMGGSAGSPEYFEVEAKDGSKTTYGGSTDSRLLVRTKPLNWMQSRFEDSVGNRIDFVYEGDTNTGQRIKSVYYAYPAAKSSNGYAARVEFNYEDRADASAGYGSGAVYFKSTKRLTSVVAYNGSSIYRKYNFYYNEINYSSHDTLSRLTSAEECTSDSVSSCYPKTRFDWAYKSVGFSTNPTWMNQLPSANKFKTYRFMDFNGDARQDFLWVRGSGTTRYIEYGAINRYASGGIQKQRFSGNLENLTYTIAKDVSNAELKLEIIDYNNDGRQDLVVCKPINEYGVYCAWDLYLSVPDSAGGWNLSNNKITLPFTRSDVLFGDTNSDGLADAIEPATSETLNVYLGQKVPGAAASSNQYYAFASASVAMSMIGTPAVPQTTFPPGAPAPSSRSRTFDYQKAILGDIDGDGRADLMIPATTATPPCSTFNICHTSSDGYSSDSRVVELFTYLNTGTEFVYSSAYRSTLGSTWYNNPSNTFSTISFKPVDFNGDGLTDIASMDGINWRYKLNAGNGFVFGGELTSIISSLDATSSIEIFDYNRDGYADALWHDKKNKQLKLRTWNSATGQMNSADTILYSSKPADHSYSVGDMTGDSFADLIELKTDSESNIDIGIFPGLGDSTSLDKIYTITDGNNRITKVNYGSLANSAHYTTISGVNTVSTTDSNYCLNWTYPAPCVAPQVYSLNSADFYTQLNRPFGTAFESANPAPLMEFIAPIYAVTEVSGSAPTAASAANLSKVTYHYHHARIQAGGRGYLGFEKITTLEQQSGVKTETTYHQDWPFIGSPKNTVVKTKEGNKLSEAANTWVSETDATNSRVRRVYTDISTETAYDLSGNGTNQGTSLQTVTTNSDYDAYGNVMRVEITTSGSANTSKNTTVNTYYPSEWELRMGRLDTSTSTTQRNSDPVVVRSSKFEYYSQFDTWPGMLKKEIVEPGSNQLVTEYEYDAVGNKKITRKTANVKPGVSQTRKTEVKYDVSGRFPETTYDSLNNVTSGVIARHSVYGVPTQVRDANGVVITIDLNADGSEKLRSDASGAWSHTDRAFCTGGISCPASARYRVITSVSGGGKTTEYFDVLGRTVRNSKVMFDGRESHVDVQYDAQGRVYRKSEPYFVGETISWSVFEYDLISRVITLTAPDGSITTNSYAGYETTATVDTAGKALTRIEERNSLGNLVKVTDHLSGTISYGYDPLGNLTSATTAASGKTVVVRMCYDKLGRKIGMHDPDKGGFLGNANETCSNIESKLDSTPGSKTAGWWFYKYNDFGELIEQTDTKRQVSTMEYDELGRMLKRTDRKTDGSVETHTRWYYDKYIGGSPAPNTQLKLTGVVTSYNRIDENCSGANYCQEYAYDGISRLTDTVTYLPNASTGYINTTKYDTIGRAFKQYDVLHGLVQTSGTRTQFNAYGYAELINDLTTGDVLQKTISVNARGQIKEELRNNGAAGTTVYTYDNQSGRLTNQTTSLAGALFGIQNVTYAWDKLGNLSSRHNQSGNLAPNGSTAKKNLQESFCYDGLNRLIKSHQNTLTGSCSLSAAAQDQEYDGLGNITRKVGMGTYTYSGKGPHAVTSTSNTGSYGYDDNGNQITGASRTITYSTYDQPLRIVSGTTSTDFGYGPSRARFERKDTKSGVVTLTHYLGNVERIQVQGSNVVEWKRYIAGAVYTVRTTAANVVQALDKSYLFNDHLGSLDVVTNAQGKITHSASFDAWGARRSGENWSSAFAASSLSLTGFTQPLTQRGFTGHEMLDDYGLIHMNGRIYDAKLARFLQADPFIQAASNTQSFNRYSYVLNNPLNATDPSGYFWNFVIAAVASYAVGDYAAKNDMPWLAQIAQVVGCYYGNAAVCSGTAFGTTYGATKNLGLAMISAFSAGATSGMGAWQSFFVSGMLGGVSSVISGGKFGHGFISAGLGAAAGSNFGYGFTGMAAAMVIGGTMSEMTGGKFKNGAASAAFSYAVMWGASKIEAGGTQQDSAADPEPDGPYDRITKNGGFSKNIKVTGAGTDKVEISIELTVVKDVSISQSEFDGLIQTIENSWSTTISDGAKSITIKTNLTQVAPDLFGGGGNFKIKGIASGRSNAQRSGYVYEHNGSMQRNGSFWSRSDTAAHEFGHLLGLSHSANNTNSLMSYSSNRSLQYMDLKRVSDAYYYQ